MDGDTREAVAERAGRRCEYCLLKEDDDVDFFHVEHVIARKHGGSDDPSNLAFACQYCNLHKGPNLSGIDPEGDPQTAVRLFNPRVDTWGEHFYFDGPSILGASPVGRATVACLNMNSDQRQTIRRLYGYTDAFE
ncbi:MAG: HNH endonuclease [Planctomycetaceae bacterium]|nr:HNH endonuclease [Planctomycetaceae bacterium]